MDIKPPQAGRSTNHRYKEKKASSRDKKHSREHRHKERERMRARDRVDRHPINAPGHRNTDRRGENVLDRDRHHQQSHGGRQGFPPVADRYEIHPRDREQYRNVYKEREKEKLRTKIDHHHERGNRKESPDKSDADRVLEDLRSRLLSKRNKHDAEKRNEELHEIDYRSERDIYRSHDHAYQNKREKDAMRKEYHSKEYRSEQSKTTSRKNIIEVIDSPENYGEMDFSSKYKSKHSGTTAAAVSEDPELIARRAKLLEAEREMARRKELAREELEARREMRRERDETNPISPQQSPVAMRTKKRHTSTDTEIHKRKRAHKDDPVVQVSDNSIDDTASDTDTNSHTDGSDEGGDESEGELPVSPLSVGELSKSERRRRSLSRSSRSRSIRSKSRSRSQTNSRSRSKSLRRSHSRSNSKSPSRTPSRSPRLRKRSRSLSSDFEKDKNPDRPTNEQIAAEETVTAAEVTKELQLPNYYPGIQGCRSVEEFQCLNRIEEGTYGVVYRARDKRTEEIVALKRLKMEKEKEGFPITSLREINTLLKGQHPNIVTVREIVVGSNMDKIFIVMDYVEHDLKSLMETMKHRKQSFLPGEVKCLTQQLLRAVGHLHDNWILHRDLKTSNLLLSHKGILKVTNINLK